MGFGSNATAKLQSKKTIFVFCLIIYGFLVNEIFFAYDLTFIMFEKSLYSKILLAHGYSLNSKDINFVFDFISLDGAPRTRFVNNLFLILDVKFRMFALQFYPITGNFSISWIIVALLTPLLFFKLAVRVFGNALMGAIAFFVFVTSSGFLGPLVMSFHPAKSLSLLFMTALLLLLTYKEPKKCVIGKGDSKSLVIDMSIVSLIFIMLFTDETMLLGLLVPILLYPFNTKTWHVCSKGWVGHSLLVIAPFALYLFITIFVAPKFVEPAVKFNTGVDVRFDFLKWAFADNANIFDPMKFLTNFTTNLKNMYQFHLNFFKSYNSYVVGPYSLLPTLLLCLGAIVVLLSKRSLFLRFMIIMLACVFLQTLLMTRHSVQTIEDPFYYGCLTSLFFTLMAVSIMTDFLSTVGRLNIRAMNLVLLIFSLCFSAAMIVINLHNFKITNMAWRGSSETKINTDYVRLIWRMKDDEQGLLRELGEADQTQQRFFLEDILLSNHRSLSREWCGIRPNSPYAPDLVGKPLHCN